MNSDTVFALAIITVFAVVPAVACSYIFYEYGYSHGANDSTDSLACDFNLEMCYDDLVEYRSESMLLSEQLENCKIDLIDGYVMLNKVSLTENH